MLLSSSPELLGASKSTVNENFGTVELQAYKISAVT